MIFAVILWNARGTDKNPEFYANALCSGNMGVSGENSINPDGEGVAGNSNSSLDNEISEGSLENTEDDGENFTLCTGGDATHPGSSWDAGGPAKISESVQ